MNILIDEALATRAVVIAALQAAIRAGDGDVTCRLYDGTVVRVRAATIGFSGNGRPFLASGRGDAVLVYVADTEWIEGY